MSRRSLQLGSGGNDVRNCFILLGLLLNEAAPRQLDPEVSAEA